MAFGIWKHSSASSMSFGSSSLESIGPDTDIVNPVTQEVVDENNADAELAAEVATLSMEVDEIQRATIAHDVGEAVASAAGAVQARGNATPEEAALIQAGAAQTVVATGGDVDTAEDVANAVATESYSGIVISNEGFVEWLKKVWQGIKDFVARVIQGIKNAWNRFWNSTASMKKKAEKIKKSLEDDYKDEFEDKDPKIESWSGWMTTLSSTKGIVFDEKNIIPRIKSYAKSAKDDIGKDVKDVIKICQDGAKAISDKKTEELKSDDLIKLVEPIMNKGLFGSEPLGSRLGSGMTGKCHPMWFDNFCIASGHKEKKSDMAPNEVINSFKITGTKYHVTDFNPKKKDPKIAVLTKSQAIELCSAVIDLADGLDDWYNKGSKSADDDIQKFRKDIDELTSKVSEESGNGIVKNRLQSAQRLFIIPTQALRGSMDICVHMIKCGNAALSYASATKGKLKKKDD